MRRYQPQRLLLYGAAAAWVLRWQSCSFASTPRPQEGRIPVQSGRHELWYRTTRPLSTDATGESVPLVVLHGGPQVPSDYLFDLAKLGGRPVVFYDQLGCGRSDSPNASDADYSIAASVADLREVLSALGMSRYHLYGQSWGGILAYEHLSRPMAAEDAKCLSAILSSAPASVPLVEREAGELVAACSEAVAAEGVAEARRGARVAELFTRRHKCRTPGTPQLLEDAQAHSGSTWRGSEAIAGWEAGNTTIAASLPALVMRGEHDFVSAQCVEGWRRVFLGLEGPLTLKGCAHHGLLEDPGTYLETVGSFVAKHG